MALPIEEILEIDPAILDRASRVIRVLGHPLRLRILNFLEGAERNVTQLVVATGVSQAAVSQQLGILRAEGIVDDRREGSRVFYRITEPKVSKILDCIRTCDVPDIRALAGADQDPGRYGMRLAPSDPDTSDRFPTRLP
jgi:ArsR family transcriptional regulator